jgi:alpha/beta superfamily hydrolase
MSGATRLIRLTLAGPAGPLEALWQEREGEAPPIVAVVCHPHPLYGGTLNNKVVHRAAGALHALGAAVLRFNFRGVGGSGGAFDQGDGELEDARVAMAAAAGRFPRAHRWLAGFSFGSWIAARLASEDALIEQLVLIAPPLHTSDFSMMRTCATPKLVIQGTADDICLPQRLDAEFPSWAEPKRLVKVDGAGHFFDRQLGALGSAIETALTGAASGQP